MVVPLAFGNTQTSKFVDRRSLEDNGSYSLYSYLSHFSFFSGVSSDAANNLISRSMDIGSVNMKWEVGDSRLIHSSNTFKNYLFLNNFLYSNPNKSYFSNFKFADNGTDKVPPADIMYVEIPLASLNIRQDSHNYFYSPQRSFKYFTGENNVNQIKCVRSSDISRNYDHENIEDIESNVHYDDNFGLKLDNRIDEEDLIDIHLEEGEIKGW